MIINAVNYDSHFILEPDYEVLPLTNAICWDFKLFICNNSWSIQKREIILLYYVHRVQICSINVAPRFKKLNWMNCKEKIIHGDETTTLPKHVVTFVFKPEWQGTSLQPDFSRSQITFNKMGVRWQKDIRMMLYLCLHACRKITHFDRYYKNDRPVVVINQYRRYFSRTEAFSLKKTI